MSLAEIAASAGRRSAASVSVAVDIISFIEAPWGLSLRLYPVQRVLLKAHYGLELDDNPHGFDLHNPIPTDHPNYSPDLVDEEGFYKFRVPVTDWRRQNPQMLTEAGYLRYLFDDGRCNIREVIPGQERREMILSVGRRSGKTLLTSCIIAYETYRLLIKGNPQAYYGSSQSNVIQLISVATDKDQAGLLYRESSGHFNKCLAADTLVVTDEGTKPIQSLVGTEPTLLTRDGSWVKAPVRSFGAQQLYEIVLCRQGVRKVIFATADHRWFARDRHKSHRGGFREFTTVQLRPGAHRLQAVFGQSYKKRVHPAPFGVAHGFTFGYGHRSGDCIFAHCPFFKDPPSPNREDKSYLLGWVMGYFAAEGCVSGGSISISSAVRANVEFFRDACILLGIGAYDIRSETTVSDITGRDHTLYRMALVRQTLDESFFLTSSHRQSFQRSRNGVARRDDTHWVVESVQPTDRVEEVYCATVGGHRDFVLDGNIATGNCDFFKPYSANATQSFATFQTPFDIERYGSYHDNQKARYSINVTFRSCVAKGLRGGANILVALDEVAHFTDEGQSSADDVYQAVEPSTRTFSPKDPKNPSRPIGENEGRIILISSPLGKQGLFYKQFTLGFTSGEAAKNMLCVQAPTWEVNPTVPAGTFEGSYLKDPRVFYTEFGAVFTDRTRGWIEDESDLMACVDPKLTPKSAAPSRMPHFMGVDIALVGDYTAVAVGHFDPQGRVVLDYIDRIRAGEGKYTALDRLDFDNVADWIADIARRFFITEGIFDQWSGIPMEQALAKRGLGQLKSLHHTKPLVSQMWQNFKNLLLDRKIGLYNDVKDGRAAYLTEILELQADYESKYIVTVEAPKVDGKHDDYSDALCRMLWVASQRMANKAVVFGNRTGENMQSSRLPTGNLTALRRAKQSGSHESRMIPRLSNRPRWR